MTSSRGFGRRWGKRKSSRGFLWSATVHNPSFLVFIVLPIKKFARTMDDGRWTMDDGRWTMDDGPYYNTRIFAFYLIRSGQDFGVLLRHCGVHAMPCHDGGRSLH